jgi:predicted DNA-binding transcriptional regulator AlpA
MSKHTIPETGFLRLRQIIGNPKANPPVPPIIPVSRTSWMDGVKSGKYPKPVRLGPRTVAWTVESITGLMASIRDESQR